MSKIIGFLKNNWIVLVLVLIIAVLLVRNNLGVRETYYAPKSGSSIEMGYGDVAVDSIASPLAIGGYRGVVGNVAPTEQMDRMVVEDTALSMLVKDVALVIKGIDKLAVESGGYMVNKSISKPEGAANGHISIRVPVEKREEVLEGVRELGVKVVSENVSGNDVTDQYVDIEGRIASLNKTKIKIEAIMDRATEVTELMNVQMQLTNIEQQIDNYRGRQKYLEQTAKLTLISINLSTDELSLPYAPDKAWRPAVVFKTAVRSMLGTVREIGNLVIWLVVYSPVWGLVVGVIYIYKKIKAKKQPV